MKKEINNTMVEKGNQAVELVKAGSNVLGQFYQDLAQPSVKAMGRALATVFELCPNSLLSLKLWTEKRKLNFAKRLNEYKKKLEQIPEDKRCEVAPEIGTPIVENLTFVTQEEIANLFTTLLANASNIDTVDKVHPAFVKIITELAPDEAKIIQLLFSTQKICYIKYTLYPDGVFDTLCDDIKLAKPQDKDMYYSHLMTLGILNDIARPFRNAESEYERIVKKRKKHVLFFNEYDSSIGKDLCVYDYCKPLEKFHSIELDNKGYYSLTKFGELFANACIKK